MKKSVPSLLALFSLAAAPLCSAQKSEPLMIKTDRPGKVGDRYETRMVAKSSKLQQVIIDAKPARKEEEKSQGVLEGLVEVQAVNKKGLVTKLKVTVSSFTMREGEEKEDRQVLNAGKVLMVEWKEKEDEQVFTVDGEEPDAATASLLDDMFDLNSSFEPGDAEILAGLDKPRAPGDSWDLDMKVVSEKMGKKIPFKISPQGSTGKMKFVEIRKVGGVDCAILEGELRLKVSALEERKGVTYTKSEMGGAFSGAYPLDPSLPAAMEKEKTEIAFESASSSDGRKADLKVSMKMESEETSRPARK